MATYDIIVRNGYLHDRKSTQDIGIANGEITTVSDSIDKSTDQEINAAGNIVFPGFIDSHIHLDKVFSARGDRLPKYNDSGLNLEQIIADGRKYQHSVSKRTLEENAVELGKKAIANGILYLRTHINVNSELDVKVLESIVAAKERLSEYIDIQIVVLPSKGILQDEDGPEVVKTALEHGGDLLGGMDPASTNGDIERTLDLWFDIADEYDVDIDCHIHDPGTLGMYVLNRLAERTIEAGYEGRVTASHAFALADSAKYGSRNTQNPGFTENELKSYHGSELSAAIPLYKEAGLKFVTCHPSTRPRMPIPALFSEDIPISWGSDNISDWVVRHSHPDPLHGMLANAIKLDYNFYTYATNHGLELLWQMATTEGANVFGIDDYQIAEEHPATLAIADAQSPQWAILDRSNITHVIKDGDVAISGGDFITDV